LLFRHSSFFDNLKYFIIMIQMTDTRNIAHANKSFAKQSPAIKYDMEKMSNNKSDIFVLCEWLLVIIFIFSKNSI